MLACTSTPTPKGERRCDADQRARHDDPAGAVEENQTVRAEPMSDAADPAGIDVAGACVDAEQPAAHREYEQQRQGQCCADDCLSSQRASQRSRSGADNERRDEVGHRQDKQLDASQARSRGQNEEQHLGAPAAAPDRNRRCGDRASGKRVGERLGHEPCRVHERRRAQRRSRDEQGSRALEIERNADEIDRYCDKRHRRHGEDLDRVIRDVCVVDQPERRRE
jgi:hypothetical protein